jgi:hypothetical protein
MKSFLRRSFPYNNVFPLLIVPSPLPAPPLAAAPLSAASRFTFSSAEDERTILSESGFSKLMAFLIATVVPL